MKFPPKKTQGFIISKARHGYEIRGLSDFLFQAQTATNMCGNISLEASNDLITWEVEASVVRLVNHLMIQNCLVCGPVPPNHKVGWIFPTECMQKMICNSANCM